MAENLATPSDVWKKMAPTSLNLAKGSSWFYFSSQPTKQIVFMRVTPATEEKSSVIKEQLRYYIEDEKMRPLSGWVFMILNLNMYLCEWLNFQHFVEERDGWHIQRIQWRGGGSYEKGKWSRDGRRRGKCWKSGGGWGGSHWIVFDLHAYCFQDSFLFCLFLVIERYWY